MSPKTPRSRLFVIVAVGCLTIPAAASAALNDAQLAAVGSILRSFKVDPAVVNRVEDALRKDGTMASSSASTGAASPTQTPAGGSIDTRSLRSIENVRPAPGSPALITAQPGAAAAVTAPKLSRNLARGSRGEDVRALQQFLIAQGLLSAESATGYFGPLTEAGVKKLQALQGIVSSGSPGTTGWGAIGPKTRSLIARWRGGGAVTENTNAPLCDAHKNALTPLYQLYNRSSGQHFYTTSDAERADFISRLGYGDYGAVAYIYKSPVEGATPLQRFKKAGSEDRIYTTRPDTATLLAQGYTFEKTEGYAYTDAAEGLFTLEQYRYAASSGRTDHAYDVPNTPVYATAGYVDEGVAGYACSGAPVIASNTVLAVAGGSALISGSGFGNNPQSANYYVTFESGKSAVRVASNSADSLIWVANMIQVKTPPGVTSSWRVSVTTGTLGTSGSAPMRVYAYSSFPSPIPGSGVQLATPLDVALDRLGTLWMTAEFSRGLASFSAAGGAAYREDIQPANPIFYIDPSLTQEKSIQGMTDISLSNQDVDVDSAGDVWYTQGSDAYTQKGASRVVRLTPSTGAQRCYNIPSDGAGISGVYVDDSSGMVWVAANSPSNGKGNFIASWQPATFSDAQASCTYDFVSAYPASWCALGETNGCFMKYQLPLEWGATHLTKGPDGNIWFTMFWGNGIGSINPKNGAILTWPLPKPPVDYVASKTYGGVSYGAMPWQLAFDSDGSLWVNEYSYASLIKFDISQSGKTACQTYETAEDNPCTTRHSLVYHYLYDSTIYNDSPHSIAIDGQDRIWFGTVTTWGLNKQGTGYLGMVDESGEFNLFPALTNLGIDGGVAGIAIDPKTQDIWFAEFWAQRIGRLTFVP